MLRKPIERQQATARGAVMAGAERGRGLDLDADAARRHADAVVRAMHDKAAGMNRLEAFEADLYPVLRRERFDRHSLRGRIAGGERDQHAEPRLHRAIAEVHFDLPTPVGPRERGAGGVRRIEALGQQIGDPARLGLRGDQAGDE